MKDEDKWLLVYGRGWVDWWELEDTNDEQLDPLFVRLSKAGKLEMNSSYGRVRLKEKDESVRV